MGLSALTALVLSSMLGAGVFVCRKIWRQLPARQHCSSAGVYWCWHFIAGLCHADPHTHSSELDGGIFTYAREGFGELIGFVPHGGTGCALSSPTSPIWCRFFRVKLFYGHAGIAPVWRCNTWQSIVGASALLWIVHFLSCAECKPLPALTWWRHWQNCAAGSVCCVGDDDVQTGYLQVDFTGLALGVPVWEQVKNTM